jgi:plastocyanin
VILHRSHLLLVAATAFTFAALSSNASSAPLVVEAVNEGTGIYGTHRWKNPEQTIIAGEKVTFRNPYTGLPYHGLKFTGTAPSGCTGTIPAAEGGAANWEGECTFSTPGDYAFICTVHPSEMKGTIIVPGTPKAKTSAASGENQTEAMLNGSIEPEGNAIEYHFEYGTNKLSENKTSNATLGAADFASHSVSAPVSGLLPKTTYHFELVATSGAGKTPVPTGEQTFTTPPPAAPTVTTSGATVMGQNEATLEGTIDPNGANATEYFFEYGATEGYGEKTTPVTGLPPDNAKHPASTLVSKLQAGATYHFRLVAMNDASGGPVNGPDRTFKTLSPPPSEPPQSPPPPPPAKEPTVTPPPTVPLFEPPPEPPLAGGPSLRSTQRGTSVKGSLDVSQSGAGGRLEVNLLAKSASLAAAHRSGSVRVGRLVHTSVSAGKVSFSVALIARGRSALRRHHRLALTVKVTLTPPRGAAVTVTRSVVLRA